MQQGGEPQASLEGRIRRTARQMQLAGVPVGTVALVVDQHSGHTHPERHSTALALVEQDGVKLPIAIDFDARHMAELRAARAPTTVRQANPRSEANCMRAS